MDGDKKRMLEAGCDGYLSKPFKIKELLQAIDIFFDSK
jgi:DNA-binding response OmpR family regulator